MLDLTQVGEYFDTHFTRTAFRLECLDVYDVPTDGGDVARYVRGEPAPDPERKQPWLNHLRTEAAAGKVRSRVHVLRTPLNDYLRYECEWGYEPNAAAGERISIIDLTDQPGYDVLLNEPEFWLFDDQHVLLMHYDATGHFTEGETVPDDRVQHYRDIAAVARNAATPFTEWWAKHPNEHRANWAA